VFTHRLRPDAVLAPLEVWHAEEFAAHMERAREHIRPWVGGSFVTDDLEGARGTLQRYAERAAADGARLYGIWTDGTLVGGVLFAAFDAGRRLAEAGCWLQPDAQGRGLITQACQVIIDWAFTVRDIHRVEWHCRAANGPSAAVARRLGMTLEGTLRESWQVGEGFDDTQVWAVLDREWTPLREPLH